jgi:hypothetical protein
MPSSERETLTLVFNNKYLARSFDSAFFSLLQALQYKAILSGRKLLIPNSVKGFGL